MPKVWSEPPASEITDPAWLGRRRSVWQAGALGAAGLLGTPALLLGADSRAQSAAASGYVAPAGTGLAPLSAKSGPYSTIEKPTTYRDVTSYNNFYEFGTGKDDPARNARNFKARPWAVEVGGEVLRPRTFDLNDLLRLAPMEERVYRMRCVEGWSMVIPWLGYALAELVRAVEPNGQAKFIEFTSLADPKQVVGVHRNVLDWPYVEGLRLDEALNPLTLLCFGLYGEVLPNQNGAPVRLVVPWKYGFKSAKSLVRIRFVREQPVNSWMRSAPQEYGFYSNVNPDVDHPRWSQASERRIGEDGFMQRKRKTLPFNGYAEQVASMYAGMDLRRFF